MTKLSQLKKATGLADLARLLDFTPSSVSYILYKLPPSLKYHSFEVPKKSGGVRIIHAPQPQLALLQSRLSKLLYECVAEQKKEKPRFWFAAHGFNPGRTIISNAEVHRRRRFVFNIDLKDFFGTINFGRIRGFFINNSTFTLNHRVATIVAQIACHDNGLPQGSPCSPVVSNLLGSILDARLVALARENRCTYTRYADDLTFSTNESIFPPALAKNLSGPKWEVGEKLKKAIEGAGFSINSLKTRMSYRRSRQTVTGLVVNKQVNIDIEYYRRARAMCSALFRTGEYTARDGSKNGLDRLGRLEGILSHIYYVKWRRDRDPHVNRQALESREFNPPRAPQELYRKFLFFKYFAAPQSPLIVTEGISDITYLKCAIQARAAKFPRLAKEDGGKIKRSVKFLKASGTSRDILNLGNGAAGQGTLIAKYENALKRYPYKPMAHPVIVLCDNDDGLRTIIKNAKAKIGKVSITSTDKFYHIAHNLYVVKVPEGDPPANKDIESLFDSSLLATVLDGKSFDPKKEHGDETSYSKVVFAEAVVRPRASEIDFSQFDTLLTRVEGVIEHYESLSVSAPSLAISPTVATPA